MAFEKDFLVFLVSGKLIMEAASSMDTVILAGVSSTVIQLTRVFPFCGVMSDVHCNTSAAVCIPII